MRRDRAAKLNRRKRRSQLILIGVIAAIAVGIAYGVLSYSSSPPRTANFGAVGSTHEHAAFRLFINNQAIDFSQPKYQLKSQYIHFEGGDGDTIHKHATNVDIGFLFETMGMKLTKDCFTMDDGKAYCNDDNTLKFYVNGVANEMYDKYVLKDNDRILVSYGPQDFERLGEQIKAVDSLLIKR